MALSLALSLMPAHARSQEVSSPQATIRKRVDLVLVDVIVTDSKGNSLGGLRAQDFQILDENAPQVTAHFSQDQIPLAIALVVDISGSMDPMMPPLRNAIRSALPALKAEDRVALFSFSYGPSLRAELTRDVEKLTRKIQGLHARGATNINDAVFRAAEYLRQASPGSRSVIILVSDTIPSIPGKKTVREVQDKLVESEVALFGVRVPTQHGLNSNPSFDSEHLRQLASIQSQVMPEAVFVDTLAEESGGFVMDVRRLEGLETAIETLFRILSTRYTLGFYPNPPGKAGSIRGVNVRLKNDEVQHVLPGGSLRFRTRYRVPP